MKNLSHAALMRGPRPVPGGWAGLAPLLGGARSRRRTLGARLDLLRSTGIGYGWRRVHEKRRLGGLGTGARDAVYRDIWSDAAARLGAELTDLGSGIYEVGTERASARLWQQVVPLDDPVTLRLAFDKPLVHELLTAAGLAVPEHLEFDFHDVRRAFEFLERHPPCVVKPASGTGGGEGTTAGVTTHSDLVRAQLRASRLDARLLIERQMGGAVYRVLLLDGEVLDVLRHLPPRLTGDGRSTLEELIAEENRRRLDPGGAAGLSLLFVSLDMVLTLGRAGLSLGSVLPAGHRVAVQTVTNDNCVEDTETFRGPLAPAIVADAAAAAREVGLRLAGVDVITPDPTRSLAETGGAIVEVNGTPGIHHHYHVADPDRATAVAVPILEKVLEGVGKESRARIDDKEPT